MSNELFDSYVRGVIDGEIVVGRWVRLAVERHVSDVEKQGTNEFPYTFDPHKASQAIDAFPAMFRHTVGAYADKPFELTPWQAYIVGSLWGWRDDRGLRRFNRCYVTLGRKNGKSTLAAGIAILMAAFDGEQQAQVYCGATKLDQAKIIFQECHRMIGASPFLREQFDRRVVRIIHDKTNSYIQALGSDKSWDGLNPSCVILDELHAFKELHRNFLDTITTGSASRLQPLRFTITTAGATNSHIWIEEETLAKQLLEGKYEEERYLAYIAQLDDDDDLFEESNWYKSMPNLGISVSPEYIREQATEGKTSKIAENKFKRYFANQMVSPNEAAIDLTKWDSCEGELCDWNGADVVTCGIDAGGRNDLGAIAYCARFPDGEDEDGERQYRYEVITKAYMDSDTSRNLKEMPFLQFIDSGELEVVPYVHNSFYEEIKSELPKMNGRQVGFDPWSTQQLAEQLDQEGFQCIMVQQSRHKLHEPTTLLIDLVEKRKIKHNGNRILRWCVGNMVLSIDNANRIMPDKKNSAEKIDCAAATIIALKLASLAPERPRGPMFIS